MPDKVERSPRRPTIRDVAERAGVSKSLVSLVLRESPKVSDKSRTAVLKAIDVLGYRPSAMARSLVSRHSGILGIVTSDAHDLFYADVIEGVSEFMSSNQLDLMPLVLHGNQSAASESRAANRFLELRCEALMLMGSALTNEVVEGFGREVPTVTVGRWVDGPSVDVVVNDDRHGAELATQHLLDLGHTRIAHITGGAGNGARQREAGFRETMERAGREATVVPGTYLQSGGVEGTRLLLKRKAQAPTAIFAANDLSAIGVLDVIRRAELRVPDDVSVIGYDDIGLAGHEAFNLTTIHQPARQMGETAAKLMSQRLTGHRSDGEKILLEPGLIVRSTTQAAA